LSALASAFANRAFSIGTMTASQAESTSDSCARTEYEKAGRGKSSAPTRTNEATLESRVVKRSFRVSKRRLSTLRQMLCNQDAACRFGLGVTRKSEQPPTVPK
jgi:hypothetical protein